MIKKRIFELHHVGDVWTMRDSYGNIFVSSRSSVLNDVACYWRLHPDVTIDEIAELFGNYVLILQE